MLTQPVALIRSVDNNSILGQAFCIQVIEYALQVVVMPGQTLDKSPLESIEDHEHLRIMENGYKLVAAEVASTAVSVDTPADLEFSREQMPTDPFFARYRHLLNADD